MGDQKKFVIAARISNEIYGAIVEGSLDFANANVISLLLDAFKVCRLCIVLLQVE